MKKLLLLFVLIIIAPAGFAQVTPYYGQGSNPGLDRRISSQPTPARKKNKKEEKVDLVELTVESLTKKLSLDGFQKAAVNVIYNENKDEMYALVEEDIPMSAKKEKMREITERIDGEIIKLLTPDQKKKYQEIIDERKY